MKIIIVGDGKMGLALTQLLSAEGHDITVIDSNPEVLRTVTEMYDVMGVLGNGACLEVQRSADAMHSDLLIAATSADETNLLCCILAKKLGCKQTIARVRNPEYASQANFLKEELGLSMTINPDRTAAHAIFRILQFPSFLKLDAFARGRVELVELRIREGSVLDGIKLLHLNEAAKARVLVCGVDREGEVTIPSGSFELKAGDMITVTAATADLAKLIKNLGISTQKINHVMLIGGSHIAQYLAAELIDVRADVKIIEQNPLRCQKLAETLPKALIANGNGVDQTLLKEEGIGNTDAVVTLTGIDEENIIISMFAEHMGVPKTVTKINRTELSVVFGERSSSSLISPKTLAAHEILRFVRALSVGNSTAGSMITMHGIMDGKAEALEFIAANGMKYLNTPLAKLNLKPHILISCISRVGQSVIIPSGSDEIRAGDSVVIVATAGRMISDLNEIFEAE